MALSLYLTFFFLPFCAMLGFALTANYSISVQLYLLLTKIKNESSRPSKLPQFILRWHSTLKTVVTLQLLWMAKTPSCFVMFLIRPKPPDNQTNKKHTVDNHRNHLVRQEPKLRC